MLKPRVGLMPMISSPLSFLRIVVFPALSSPLDAWISVNGRDDQEDKSAQEENSHFFLLLAIFADDREETHVR